MKASKFGGYETSWMREARLFNHGERSKEIRRKHYKKCARRECKEEMRTQE